MASVSPAKKSDLGVRTLSAIVMLAVTGGALWLGGWWWTVFVGLVAVGVLWEWNKLTMLVHPQGFGRLVWRVAGLIYCGVAAAVLVILHQGNDIRGILLIAGSVIATDVGAYLSGRAIGGPKIAPRISPSKTWAGLGGGIVAAAAVMVIPLPWTFHDYNSADWLRIASIPALAGATIAIIAQSGDFFESWMKRRAGVKDSGNLIPGHGGLFDRVDGLLAVCFVSGVIFMFVRLWGGL
ncbi:MAG: phosphatidate cytidylyltransferase [Novosphingobium sp.]|nr:phosphatidate cytidylyltransferase [Novosphingobium sp.]